MKGVIEKPRLAPLQPGARYVGRRIVLEWEAVAQDELVGCKAIARVELASFSTIPCSTCDKTFGSICSRSHLTEVASFGLTNLKYSVKLPMR